MKKKNLHRLNFAGFLLASFLFLFATSCSAQGLVTKLKVLSYLNISFEVTVTFNDNTTASQEIAASSNYEFTAPSGLYITKLTAGTKTVDVPMDPSVQTGWNIPNTPSGEVVEGSTSPSSWGDYYAGEIMMFEYEE